MAAVRHLEYEFCYSGPPTKSTMRFDYHVNLGGVARKKSITRTRQDRTGQDRTTKKSQKRNISHIWGEAPRKDIAMKFGTGVDVLEVVTVAEFDLENLRGVNFTGG